MIYLREVLKELHQDQLQPTPVYNDNKSTITLGSKYSGSIKRVRYMVPRINWLMEQCHDRICELRYLHTSLLPPDMGTKVVSTVQFVHKRDSTLGHPGRL
jgi:hypothetical protein